MGSHETFICQDCGFKYTDDHTFFFYNNDSNEIVEFIHLLSTVGISDGSKIKGSIIESYCKHCNKFIKTFYIENVDCPQYNPEDIIDIVKSGIKNNLKRIKNDALNRIKELNEIKSRKKYKLEIQQDPLFKDKTYVYIEFLELGNCYHRVCIEDFDCENEAIEYCKRHSLEIFKVEVDRQIIDNRNYLKKILKYNYRVKYWDFNEDTSIKTITCTKCGNEVYKFINADYPCPKCEGKLIHTQTILSD